ncbi:MAG: hypothetical protein KGS45_12645 [Planctomycetes bacterium]|nr:hypothetical protein [Planctomycetota bacterium]
MIFLTRRLIPLVALLGSLAIIGQSFYMWDATGRRWFTQFHDPALIPAPPDDLDILLAQAGAFENGRAPDIDNHFRFGLFPSGLDRFALSFTTFVLPSVLLASACIILLKTPLPTPNRPAK